MKTDRLDLRPLSPDHADALHRLWTEESVRQFLWDGEILSEARTRGMIESSAALFEGSGFGLWGLFERESPELIGFAGLWFFRDPPELELVFGLAPGHRGMGLATEAARRVVRFAFEELAFDRVAASRDAPNTASARVLEKLGMRSVSRAAPDGQDTSFYSLAREDWAPDGSAPPNEPLTENP